MKQLVGIVTALGIVHSAHAHPAGSNAEGCHDDALAGSFHCHGNDPVIVAGLPDVPLTDASVEVRNPIAPQSNYAARTIEDDRIFAAQVVLRKNGCYDGRLDGVLADGTVYAIKLFEANIGLLPTGELTPETESALRDSHDRFDICR